MVESRAQGPVEAATEYINNKILMLTKRASQPIAEADEIPFLIRVLHSIELRCSSINNFLLTLNEFLAVLKHKWALMTSSVGQGAVGALQTSGTSQ